MKVRLVLMILWLGTYSTAFGQESASSSAESGLRASNGMTEEKFHGLIDHIENLYAPVVGTHGAVLKIKRLWASTRANASAMQFGNGTWELNVHGGMARHESMTDDSFVLILCHEMGHHLGGFPFMSAWGATEGQADYFATHSCARELWKNDKARNASFGFHTDAIAKRQCNQAWTHEDDQNLCHRIMTAAHLVVSFLGHGTQVAFDTPSLDRVGRTYRFYPSAQCRLDTMAAGALCTQTFDVNALPRTEAEAEEHSCLNPGFEFGLRPRCWFAPTST